MRQSGVRFLSLAFTVRMAVAQRLNVTQAKPCYPCSVVALRLGARFPSKVSRITGATHSSSAIPFLRRAANDTGVPLSRPSVDWLELRAIKVVVDHVARAICQLKVLCLIVLSVAVDMMNNLVGLEFSPKGFFHDKAMFTGIFLSSSPSAFKTCADSYVSLVVNLPLELVVAGAARCFV